MGREEEGNFFLPLLKSRIDFDQRLVLLFVAFASPPLPEKRRKKKVGNRKQKVLDKSQQKIAKTCYWDLLDLCVCTGCVTFVACSQVMVE